MRAHGGTPGRDVWFHDLLHEDGTPYDPAEVATIRALTAAGQGETSSGDRIMTGVTLTNVIKKYGDAGDPRVDLGIEDGEFCVFVGPSGCGKSTLLRMIAGLEETTDGQIAIGPRDVTRMDPAERGVAMVFQTYALYPHMTVEQNMGFGLRMSGHPKPRSAEGRRGESHPQTRRLPRPQAGRAVGRAAPAGRHRARHRAGPEVFLFDEPLSNLDAELRVEMRVEIARLHKEIGATMIYVTHDQVEAMTLADKIVVLKFGVIEQVGAPLDLYRDPDNKFVAGFIGSPSMNFVEGTVADGGIEVPAFGRTVTPAVTLPAKGTRVIVGLRPEHAGSIRRATPSRSS